MKTARPQGREWLHSWSYSWRHGSFDFSLRSWGLSLVLNRDERGSFLDYGTWLGVRLFCANITLQTKPTEKEFLGWSR